MYFEKCGKENTQKVVECALKYAHENNIKNIVVASSTGETIKYFKDVKDINIVCVSHSYGFPNVGTNDMPKETKNEIESLGIPVLQTTHVLSGAERGISKQFGGVSPVEIIAETLRMFGQGTKVCVEISTMALDSGLIPYDESIIAIGGSAHGADTAILLKPAHASKIFDTKIEKIICKPATW